MLAVTFRSIIFEYSYQALLLILIISGPPILFASIIGIFVAIFQAATQIQEQTLAFAIKMVAVMATVILMGGWLGALIYQFASQIFQNFYKWTT
ncbi:MAG: type III secretion system export apparatus subunit SctS [Chlamydiales bacterium]|nr:type III secretion system export apparatus subunit SctS [Chlamydiales bacterium]